MKRFFVRVFATDRKALRALQSYDFDFFRGTSVAARLAFEAAAAAEARGEKAAERLPGTSLDALFSLPSIEGLLTLVQIERLVVDGYRVLVEEDADRRARGRTETVELGEWLRGMEAD